MKKQQHKPPEASPPPPVITKTTFSWLVAIITAGVSLRLFYLHQISEDIFTRNLVIDAKFYHEWALGILRGSWNSKEAFYQDPLYAYFLAACYAVFGQNPLSARLAQVGLDAGTLGLLFVLGNRLFNARVGILCALIGALYGPMIYYCGLLDKTTVTLFLTALSLVCVLQASRQSHLSGLILSGLVFGIACLARGNMLFAALAATLWLAWNKHSFSRCAAFAASFALVVGLVAARNYRASGDFVLLTANAGLNFFIGNNPNSVGTYLEPPFLHGIPEEEFSDSKRAAEHFSGKTLMKASAVSGFWMQQGLNFIRHRPASWLNLVWKKIFLTFHRFEIPETYSFYYFKERAWSLGMAFLDYGLIAPLGLLGAILYPLRGQPGILLVFLLTYSSSLCLFFITSRYRFPLVIPLIVLSAALLCEAQERFRSRAWGWITSALSLLFILFFFSRWNPAWMKNFVVVPSLATPHTIAGYLHLQPPANAPLAIKELEKARALNPGESNIHAQLGTAYERTGRIDEAVASLEQAVRGNNGFHEAYNNLAMLYFRQGRIAPAREAMSRALQLRPDEPSYQSNYRRITAHPTSRRR